MVTVTIDSIIPSDPGTGYDKTRNSFIAEGTLVLSGSYGHGSPVAGGDLLSFAGFAGLLSRLGPKRVEIFQYPVDANAPIHYSFLYGSTEATPTIDGGVLYVIDSTTGLPIATGAYPGALTADTTNIRFKAWFPLEL